MGSEDFQSLFGADTGEFKDYQKQLEDAVKQSFSKIVSEAKKSGVEIKSVGDQLAVINNLYKLQNNLLKQSEDDLSGTINEYTKFVKELKKSTQPFDDLETTLKAVKAGIESDLIKKMEEANNSIKMTSENLSKEFVGAIKQTGSAIANVSNEMYSSAGSVVSFYRYWLSDMPKKFGGAFTKMSGIMQAWGKNSDAKKKYKQVMKDYENFQNEFGKKSKSAFSTLIRSVQNFVKNLTRSSKSIPGGAGGPTRGGGGSAVRSSKSIPGGAGGPTSGGGGSAGGSGSLGGKLSGIMGGAASGLGMVGSLFSAIGSVIANNIQFALDRGNFLLEKRMQSYEGFASQGIYSNKAFEAVTADMTTEVTGKKMEKVLRQSEAVSTGLVKVGLNFLDGQSSAEKFLGDSLYAITKVNRTYFKDLKLGEFLETVTRRTIKAGQDFNQGVSETFEKVFGDGGLLPKLITQGNQLGISSMETAKIFSELNSDMLELNETVDTTAALIANIQSMDSVFQKIGVDIKKSLGQITKGLTNLMKNWSMGLKAFMGMKALGGKTPFAGAYRMEAGKPGQFNAVMGEAFSMIEQVAKGAKGEGEKYAIGKLMSSQLFGADSELAKIIGVTLEETGDLQGLLANKEIMERIKTAQEMSQKTEKEHLQGIHTAAERQDKNQILSLKMQEVMLNLSTNAVGMFAAYMLKMISVGYEIKLALLRLMNVFGGDDKSKKDQETLEKRIQLLDEKNAKLLSDSTTGFTEAMGEFNQFLKGAALKQALANLSTTTEQVGAKGFVKVTSGVMGAIDTMTMSDADVNAKHAKKKGWASQINAVDALPTNHFGGNLEKFHYGGIIKQGTEALLMTPNPTSVLSPNDTRQAVRGSKEKHVHVHFNAPVYGIPKFEEMINRMIMKAATGVR